jgi:hypothetical protein
LAPKTDHLMAFRSSLVDERMINFDFHLGEMSTLEEQNRYEIQSLVVLEVHASRIRLEELCLDTTWRKMDQWNSGNRDLGRC